MVAATVLMPPIPGLSETLLPNKGVEPYSPSGPAKVIIATLYRYTGRLFMAVIRHNDNCRDH